MSDREELKQAVEQLSEQEFQRLQLLQQITDLATDMDVEDLNELPSLYRMEIKRALRESGEQRLADRIRS